MTTIVADTGDIDSIKEYQPTDATTNPSLLFLAAQQPQYNELVSSAVRSGMRAEGVDAYAAHEDPGVKSVTSIYNYYKKHDYETIVMGASFRNTDEILELAGCDYLTIAPKLMEMLQQQDGDVERKLDPEIARHAGADKTMLDEKAFRWQMNDDAMATEKFAEGIRGFTADTLKLVQYMKEVCQNC